MAAPAAPPPLVIRKPGGRFAALAIACSAGAVAAVLLAILTQIGLVLFAGLALGGAAIILAVLQMNREETPLAKWGLGLGLATSLLASAMIVLVFIAPLL